jgi:hypothetical protein
VQTRWRQLAVLSLAELLALSLWFSASAVLPALRSEWDDEGWVNHWWPAKLRGTAAPRAAAAVGAGRA